MNTLTLYKVVCNGSQKNMQGKLKLQGLIQINSKPRASNVSDILGDATM